MKTQVDIRAQIAQRLVVARQRQGYLTGKMFCAQHDFSLWTYQRHEKGALVMDASQLMRYADALGVSLNVLLFDDGVFSEQV